MVVPDRPPSLNASAKAVASLGAIYNSDSWVDHKEKDEEKKKEPMFIRGVERVDPDDCKVFDMKLQCFQSGGRGCRRWRCFVFANLGPAKELLPTAIAIQSKCLK